MARIDNICVAASWIALINGPFDRPIHTKYCDPNSLAGKMGRTNLDSMANLDSMVNLQGVANYKEWQIQGVANRPLEL